MFTLQSSAIMYIPEENRNVPISELCKWPEGSDEEEEEITAEELVLLKADEARYQAFMAWMEVSFPLILLSDHILEERKNPVHHQYLLSFRKPRSSRHAVNGTLGCKPLLTRRTSPRVTRMQIAAIRPKMLW